MLLVIQADMLSHGVKQCNERLQVYARNAFFGMVKDVSLFLTKFVLNVRLSLK